ncbi:MAG TPA: helix-turn-helix domain-containing protein, partial [Burkholderiales bacterium]|nr:helix-turn-helix domain-containing protein [Burkholderiales bacterium]
MHPQTIYTKTPKGVLEVKNKTAKLPRELGLVFLAVDGKSTVADLLKKSGMEESQLHEALEKLAADGFIKVFSAPAEAAPKQDESLDLDFTSSEAIDKLNAEAAA